MKKGNILATFAKDEKDNYMFEARFEEGFGNDFLRLELLSNPCFVDSFYKTSKEFSDSLGILTNLNYIHQILNATKTFVPTCVRIS